MNDDQRAFEQYCEAHGVHFAKQAAQLADYDTGDDMHAMLKKVLAACPNLQTAAVAKHIGNPTDHGEEPTVEAERVQSYELTAAAEQAKKVGTIAARVKYAQTKRQ